MIQNDPRQLVVPSYDRILKMGVVIDHRWRIADPKLGGNVTCHRTQVLKREPARYLIISKRGIQSRRFSCDSVVVS